MIAFSLSAFGTKRVFGFIAANMLMVILSIGIFGDRKKGLALEAISHAGM